MAQCEPFGGGEGSFCSNCGERVDAGVNFCGSCGVAAGIETSQRPTTRIGNNRTSHIKHRNMIVEIVLTIVTLGIYLIYWYYVTLDELQEANGNPQGVGRWTFLSAIPFVQLFAQWHHSSEYARFVNYKYSEIGIFILWIVFPLAVVFLVQSDLNRVATRTS